MIKKTGLRIGPDKTKIQIRRTLSRTAHLLQYKHPVRKTTRNMDKYVNTSTNSLLS